MRSDWPVYKLSDFINVKHGFAFKGESIVDKETDNYLVTPGNFSIGGGFKSDKFKYFDGEIPEDYIFKKNDLIVNMTDLSKEGDTLGYSALVPEIESKVLLHNQRVGLVEFKNDGLDKIFLYFLLRTSGYRHHVLGAATGATVKHTSPTRIVSYEFRKPPINEQIEIGTRLRQLELKIELNRQINQTLEQMAQTIFKSWFVDFDPVRAKMEGRDTGLPRHIEDLFPDELVESELGLVPKGWGVLTLNETTSEIIDHRGKTPKKLGGDWSKNGYPALSAKNIKLGRIVNHESIKYLDGRIYKKWMKTELEIGDILLTSEAPLGEMYFLTEETKYCLSQRLYALRSNPEIMTPSFLYLWLLSDMGQADLHSRATGSTVVGIRQSELRKVNVLIPIKSLLTQFEELVFPLLTKLNENEVESRALADIRDLLLPKLLSGEIKVGEVA